MAIVLSVIGGFFWIGPVSEPVKAGSLRHRPGDPDRGIVSMKVLVHHQLKRILAVVAAAVVMSTAAIAQPAPTDTSRIVQIKPMTTDVEVLYGDPDKAGDPFVIRIRELAGGIIPPHRHDTDEHLTVVQGTLYFAVGDRFDRAQLREMKTGSYAFIPKGSIMFGYTPDAAIVQVHGIGPFKIHWRSGGSWQHDLKTLDSPDAPRLFKFKRGDRVVTPRGAGRIRQGYDSGEVVGYEIDGDDGSLFIAEECEISDPKGAPSVAKCFSRGTGSSGLARKHKHGVHLK